MKHLRVIGLVLAMTCNTAAGQQNPTIIEYSDMCDASAAAAISADMFIVASDEDNVLRVYRRGEPKVVQAFSLDQFLRPDPHEPEADIEGAARIDDRIYWVTSHGQNKNGKNRPSRHRPFATTVALRDGEVTLTPVGTAYRDLRADLIGAPQLAKYNLKVAATIAPENPGGLNIEGLAAAPDGRLLLGFRNPITEKGKALVVPIENPKEVIRGKKAKIGKPIEIVLDGRGIRSLEFNQERNLYLIVAGPYGDVGSFALYTWSGQPGKDPEIVKGVDLGTLNLEAIYFAPGDKDAISDDGGRKINGRDCKKVDRKAQSFRAMSLIIP
ncbi:DUF3616 domain-containing protein [Bradyrhizobium sp. CCGUVB23]|uniref:DUF3616 domain-containing protein n=1 Tax=Bradyrhizobium sp. CCGUVB23 TaxID=2949630 RepID=UPI0020B2F378|nr:DUF3616 domain-containing protein [Bradyrhizobium sp. CCGUVB23]MCP3460313.1 DUF3616 domain-containing protein [Bradyrhizobium sp. CCGUVB23]